MAAMAADEKTAMAADEHRHRATLSVMAADEKTVMAADEHRHRAAE